MLIKKSLLPSFMAVLAVFALSACDLYEETKISENRIQVEESQFVEKIPAAELNADYAAALASQYNRYGDGSIDLTVVYDPASRVNTAMGASNHASRIIGDFKKNGITDVAPNILPVKGQGDEALALITYTSYSAHGPKDCGTLSGFDDRDVRTDEDYKLGCTVETAFAKQIARPKDLNGNAVDKESDGRRASNIVEGYRTGVQNKPLGGESSSGL